MRKIPRWLARSPIGVFKIGLGGVFAGRLVMVEHIGRVSGERRYVVVEVLVDDCASVVVASGYGRAAQWYRNVEARPSVRIWKGWRRAVPARADLLDPDASVALLEEYRRTRPRQAATVAKGLGLHELLDDAPIPYEVGERVPLVRFVLDDRTA